MRLLITLCAATVVLAGCNDSVTAPTADTEQPSLSKAPETGRRYRVTITNLTTGQPLSPGVVVTHRHRVSLFELGHRASEGIRQIAENGDPAPAAAALTGIWGVGAVVSTPAPVGRMGGGPFPSSLTVEIDASAGSTHLSMAMMLICTNDGFAGLDGVRLPGGFREERYYARGYDAGTERNTEVASSIVPPCFAIGPVQGPTGGPDREAEHRRIRYHRGIAGIGVLTSAHDWTGPVARVSIQRIK